MVKFIVLCALFAVCSGAATEKDRTITQVVKLLQDMLDKSVKEGDAERVIYAKFKCYCDTSEAEKKASVKEQTELIALLESKIAEIQGDTGGLSSECADLKAKIADNKAAQDEATTIRKKENKAFEAETEDLSGAIEQMRQALETLAKVGGDQTKSTGADNTQFMAGHKASLLSLQTDVQDALRAASALMSPAQQHATTSFLQAPFTGTYTSQSGQVVGILKSMRDTFRTNLADAQKTETNAQTAYDKLMTILKAAHKEMSESYEGKQKALGGNDGSLATKRKQLSDAKKQLASDEAFLDKLLPLCAKKAAGFDNRKLLRANEETAIAEAISILNSDDAFASFGTTDATSKGGVKFIQLRAVHRHVNGAATVAQSVLRQAAKETKSPRLSKVLALLQAENPFDEVLAEIAKMIELIGEEGDADQENLDWCNKERKENKASLATKKKEILALEKTIDGLTKDIEDPKTGLKVQIQETEQSLVDNKESQTKQTADRLEDNVAYQQDVKNLVKAQSILTKATKVLKVYYDDLEAKLAAGEAFIQKPAKKKTMKEAEADVFGDNSFKGQSGKGGDVITMLEFIHSETVKEENEAHENEEKSQADYEDSMTKLKSQEAADEKQLADLQDELAEKEKALLEAQEDLKATTADKEAIEAYLLKIKPGCDFITKNFGLREKNRATEKTALKKAIRLIEGTPAYKAAETESTVESYGDCIVTEVKKTRTTDEKLSGPCAKDRDHVKCKACMNDVTIPAYCAGHKGTPGC